MFQLTISAEGQRTHLRRFWYAAMGYWRGSARRRAWALTALLVAIVLLQLLTQFRINLWNRDFFDALERGSRGEVWRQGLVFGPLVAASTLLLVFLTWGRMAMQRQWRGWLTAPSSTDGPPVPDPGTSALRSSEHRNPEYRLAEDARIATELPVDFALGLLTAVLSAVTFIGVLWHIGGDIVLPFFGHQLPVSGYLVVSVIVYSAVTTLLMLVVGDRLMPMVEEKNQAESELRFAATRLREASEEEGFSFERGPELASLRRSLTRLLDSWRRLTAQLMRTVLVSQANTLLAPVVGLLLCVPKYLADTMSLGEVVQAAAAFVIVQGAFNWLVAIIRASPIGSPRSIASRSCSTGSRRARPTPAKKRGVALADQPRVPCSRSR